jgi:diadenosine tetraphosphate (Ap4A) HIT family hydrolase
MRLLRPLVALLLGLGLHAQSRCNCDPSQPDTMKERPCSLCAEVEKEPPNVRIIFRKDINPHKPNRIIVMPRAHTPGMHELSEYTPEQRTELWTAAINKGKEMWGDQWGIAYNGDVVRTQCHAHLHVSKLLDGVEWGEPLIVDSPAEIPLPEGHAMWIHPVGGKLHVHRDDQIAETVLLR